MTLDVSRRKLFAGTTAIGAGAATQLIAMPAASANSISYNQVLPQYPRVAHSGEVLHDARFAQHGFSRYKNLHPAGMVAGKDLGISRDPAGSLEPVAWFDSSRGLTHGNSHRRASVESPAVTFATAHENTNAVYAHRVSFYLPSKYAMSTTSHWTTIAEVHGPPWKGASKNSLMIVFNPQTKRHYFRLGNDTSLLKEADTIIPLDRWVDVMIYMDYNYASKGGWIRMFMNTTGNRDWGWRTVPIRGNTGKYETDLISNMEGNAWYHDKTKGAATPRVGVYGNHVTRLYVRDHVLAKSVRGALGATWNGLIDGKTLVA